LKEVFMEKKAAALAGPCPGVVRFRGRQKRGMPWVRALGAVAALGIVLVLFGRCDLPNSPPPVETPDLEDSGEDISGTEGEDGETPDAGTGKPKAGGGQGAAGPKAGDGPEGEPETGDEADAGAGEGDPAAPDTPDTPGEPGAPEEPEEPEGPEEEPVLSAIEISEPPDKAAYAKGEALDLRGLQVTGRYTDGASRLEDPAALQFSGYDPARTGEQQVVVSLEGKTAEFTVRVSLSELDLSLSRPAEGELSVEGLPPGNLALSRTGAEGLPQRINFSAAGYEPLLCFVNGRPLAPEETAGGDPVAFMLDAGDYGTGRQYLTLIGFTGGIPRSREQVLDVFE
jgi:hypothetical protein